MLHISEKKVPPEVIDTLYDRGFIELNDLNLPVNSYILLRSLYDKQHTGLAIRLADRKLHIVRREKRIAFNGVSARDIGQLAFMHMLDNQDVLLNVAVGRAGTGKTTIALAYAAYQYLEHQKPIYLAKPTVFVGFNEAFGPVPGTIEEKYAPYLESYKIVMKKVFGDQTDYYFKQMQERGHLNFIPISLVRGCTYENATFIVDEVQNLTWHQLNSLISRMGQGTKLILLGDLDQVDIDLAKEDTGLYKLIQSQAYKNSAITSAIELVNQYRSPITELIAEVNNEIKRGTIK